jgi:alpha-tubulin suppressor-like RCC1 family protein
VTAITAGADHVCALLSGGTVDCFGWNMSGQLGVGTSTGPQTCGGNPCSMSPVAVSGLSGVTAISAGAAGTCALLSGGTVKCWGDNTYGELGDGTSTGPQTCIAGSSACSTTPVAVSGLSGVSAIAASEAHTCALLSGGTVDCWGDNEAGELGDGTSTGPQTCSGAACSTTPVAVSSLTGATAIGTSFLGSCVLRSGGSIECWGDNQYGDLGIGTSTGPQTCTAGSAVPCSTTPTPVSGL